MLNGTQKKILIMVGCCLCLKIILIKRKKCAQVICANIKRVLREMQDFFGYSDDKSAICDLSTKRLSRVLESIVSSGCCRDLETLFAAGWAACPVKPERAAAVTSARRRSSWLRSRLHRSLITWDDSDSRLVVNVADGARSSILRFTMAPSMLQPCPRHPY